MQQNTLALEIQCIFTASGNFRNFFKSTLQPSVNENRGVNLSIMYIEEKLLSLN